MAKLSTLEGKLDNIVTALNGVGEQLNKAKAEIIAALGDVEIPSGAMLKLDALDVLAVNLRAASQALDDLNADAPAPE